MPTTPRAKAELYLASSLCDGLEDNNIRQVTTLLLSKEADPNVLIPSYGITPFHLVVGNDSETFAEEVTKLFLRHGGNPNVTSTDGLTPVHVAAAWGRLGVLELLLANGGDPISLDDEGCTPFHYAFDGKYYKAITILGKYCSDATDKEESIKYNRKLDKVFVNNGDIMAEYVIAEKPPFEADSEIRMSRSFDELDYRATRSAEKIQQSFETDCEWSDEKSTDNFVLSNRAANDSQYSPTFSDETGFRESDESCIQDLTNTFNLKNIKLTKNVDKEKLADEFDNSPSLSVTTETENDKSSFLREKCKRDIRLNAAVHAQVLENSIKPLLDAISFSSLSEKSNKLRSLIPTLQRKSFSRNNIEKRSVCSPKTPTGIKTNDSTSTFGDTMSKRCEHHFSKIPVRLDCSVNDRVISGSPRFRTKTVMPVEHSIRNGFNDNFQAVCQTPPRMPNDKLLKRGKIAQSTPRKKTHSRCNFSSVKRLKTYKNRRLQSSKETDESTILSESNAPTPMTFEDSETSFNLKRRGYNPYAINLNECRYDIERKEVVIEDLNIHHLRTNVAVPKIENNSDIEGILNKSSIIAPESDSSFESLTNNVSFGDAFPNDKLNSDRAIYHNKRMVNQINNIKTEAVEAFNKTERSKEEESFTANLSALSNHNCTLNVNDEKLVLNTKTEKANLTESHNDTSSRLSTRTYVSIQEEYKYEDLDEGVILLERRCCVTPCRVSTGNENDEYLSATESWSNKASFVSDVPSEILLLDDFTLRSRLAQLGDVPGPITKSTRHIYLKRLTHLEKRLELTNISTESKEPACCKIKSGLEYGNWVNELAAHCALEKRVFQEFTTPDPSRKWREGTAKASFNYLLLDSRKTQDLPQRSATLSESDVWAVFISSIFYIGKGKRSRPYAHLYDAFNCWVSKANNSKVEKIQYILDIWNDGYGVVCLHVFQNIIPVEAYTREAAMIDAIGVENLKNNKAGEYYGIPATWGIKEKSKFGKYLLYKAMRILMHEGERQLFPQYL